MRRIPPPLLGVLLSAALVAAAGTRTGAASGGAAVAFRGLVAYPAGAPLPHARVSAMIRGADGAPLAGGRGFTATTDDSGHFALEVPLPDRATLAKRGFELNLWASARGAHFTVPDGQASLGLDLHFEKLPDGAMRVVGAANDPRLSALGARAAATGARVEMDGVLFIALLGEQTREPGLPTRLEVARVAVTASPPPAVAAARSEHGDTPPVTRPAAPRVAPRPAPATPPAPSAAASEDPQTPPVATAKPARTRDTHPRASHARSKPPRNSTHPAPATAPVAALVTHAADPAPAPPRAAVDTIGCVCRVSGTVEATAGDPLPAPAQVAVWIDGEPALADTITLEMGSPRPFLLTQVPCGRHRLAVRVLSDRLRFFVRDPQHVLPFDCAPGLHPQPHVELLTR